MNRVFPAAYSTLSPSALASLILEKYDIGAVQCTFLLRGVGDTYLVESSDKRFILRVYRNSHRNLEHIRMETSLLLTLKEADVPVSYPIQDHSGEVIQTLDAVEGTRHVVLFSYAPGTVVSKLGEQQLRTLGTQMARLHRVSSTVELAGQRWNFDMETMFSRPLRTLE
ncbi:MAG TPA: phosphotransferase, partial [Puia sp.]